MTLGAGGDAFYARTSACSADRTMERSSLSIVLGDCTMAMVDDKGQRRRMMARFIVSTLMQNSYDGLYETGQTDPITDVNDAIKCVQDVSFYIDNLRNKRIPWCESDLRELNEQTNDRIISVYPDTGFI